MFTDIVQLFCFICLLLLVNQVKHRKYNSLEIPFINLITSTVLYSSGLIVFESNLFLWMSLSVVLSIAVIILKVKYHWLFFNFEKGLNAKMNVLLGWTIFIAVTISLFATLCTANIEKTTKVSRQTNIYSQAFLGEDNAAHMNLLREIGEQNHATYFLSREDFQDRLFPPAKTYPQFPHIGASVVFDIDRLVSDLTGRETGDTQQLIESYVLALYMAIAMAVALAITFSVVFVNKLRSTSVISIFVTSIFACVMLIDKFAISILAFGFFSFIPLTCFLVLQLFIEILLSSDENKDISLMWKTLLRLVPIIAIGHTWWLLLPVSFGFISILTVRDLIKDKNNLRSNVFKLLAVFIPASLFAALPAFLLIFYTDTDIQAAAETGGGIKELDVGNVISYSFITLFCFVALYGYAHIKKKSNLKAQSFIYSIFTLLTLFLTTSIVYYQRQSIGNVSYYGFKVSWALFWLPSIALIILGLFVFNKILDFKLFSNVWVKAVFVGVVLICGFAISIPTLKDFRNEYRLALSYVAPSEQLRGLIQASDLANRKDKHVIIVFDCNQTAYFYYYHQKYALLLSAKFSDEIYSYMRLTLSGEPDIKEFEKIYIKLGAKNLYYYDMTPSQLPPASKLSLFKNNVEGARTTYQGDRGVPDVPECRLNL